jgi:nucleoid-associated protein YgaU
MAKKKTTKKSTSRVSKIEPRAAISRADSRSSARIDESDDIFKKVSSDLQQNNSILNLVLGALVVIVAAALIFNYFKKSPAVETNISSDNTQQVQQQQTGDVAKDKLPGEYTVKDGDTLFTIAQNYYNDGYKYSELVKANSLTNENQIEVGQKITVPKLDQTATSPEESPGSTTVSTLNAQASPAPTASPAAVAESTTGTQTDSELGTGGAVNQTIWGERISGETYTVQAGDWLSTIAGRAYGDIMMYSKIAQANNLQNPDLIEPGTVLKIPR